MWTDHLGPKEEEIITWATAHGLFRWTSDLQNEFQRKRGWKHSTFINHWNKVKDCFQRLPDGWVLKPEYQNFGSKAWLRTRITQGQLAEIAIPLGRYDKVVDSVIEKFDAYFTEKAFEKGIAERKKLAEGRPADWIYETAGKVNQQLATQRKLTKNDKKKRLTDRIVDRILGRWSNSDMEVIGEHMYATILFPASFEKAKYRAEAKSRLTEIFKGVKIQILTSPGETPPTLADDDIAQLVSIVASKILDENKGKPRENPFQLIVSYPMK